MLPPELRNSIYSYVLVSNQYTRIDQVTWNNHQPSLLRTCRTMRREGIKIFYTMNDFMIALGPFDGSVAHRFHGLMDALGLVKEDNRFIKVEGAPNWPNLLIWLKRFHEEGGPCLGQPPLGRRTVADNTVEMEQKIVGAAFHIVARCADMRWDFVKELLETQHVILEQLDSRWA